MKYIFFAVLVLMFENQLKAWTTQEQIDVLNQKYSGKFKDHFEMDALNEMGKLIGGFHYKEIGFVYELNEEVIPVTSVRKNNDSIVVCNAGISIKIHYCPANGGNGSDFEIKNATAMIQSKEIIQRKGNRFTGRAPFEQYKLFGEFKICESIIVYPVVDKEKYTEMLRQQKEVLEQYYQQQLGNVRAQVFEAIKSPEFTKRVLDIQNQK